jgi:hypothetical protein
MVPVGAGKHGSGSRDKKGLCRSRLVDLDDSDAASRGAWGGGAFFFCPRHGGGLQTPDKDVTARELTS